VAWFDTRSDPGLTSNDVYYASSSDNGATWAKNVRVTDQSIDRKIGVYASRFDLNAPPGIASTDSFALVAWDDTRNFDTVTEGQDIYVAAVQYDEIEPATSNLLKYGLAAVVGLAVVGVLFVLLALLARRREAGPTGARRPAPAG
jgi:Neuraminidase (sialidase)